MVVDFIGKQCVTSIASLLWCEYQGHLCGENGRSGVAGANSSVRYAQNLRGDNEINVMREAPAGGKC